MKRPSFQFYPGDWQRDINLRSCSLAARGLWIEMMAIFHQSDRYGYLPDFLLKQISSKAQANSQASVDQNDAQNEDRDVLLKQNSSKSQANTQANSKQVLDICLTLASPLARMVGSSPDEIEVCLHELIDAGVVSMDERGALYSRRMVRDEEIRQVRADAGLLGGKSRARKEAEVRNELLLLKQNSSKSQANTQTNTQANTQAKVKQTSSKHSSKSDPLHLQSSLVKRTPLVAPRDEPDAPPSPPKGGDQQDGPVLFDGLDDGADDRLDDGEDGQAGHALMSRLIQGHRMNGSICERHDLGGSDHADVDVAVADPAPESPAEDQGQKKRARGSQESRSLKVWLREVRSAGQKAIPPEDPVFAYATEVGVPVEFLRMHWREFERIYTERNKGYKDWRAVFRRSVRNNWFRLWYFDRATGECMLTTSGVQASREMDAVEGDANDREAA